MQVKRSSMLPGRGRTVGELAQLSTAQLVALAQAGDREAFDPLYRRFAGRVLANAVNRVNGDRVLAEDVASETWAMAVADIGQWQGRTEDADQDFLRWLFGITRGRVRRLYATGWRELAVEPVQGEWGLTGRALCAAASEESVSPDKTSMLARLRAAVDALSPRQREVVRLRMEGLSSQDIAVKTELTMQQVRAAWNLAQASLRRAVCTPIEDADPAQVRAAVRLLPQSQRQVALLRLTGMRAAKIAEQTGLRVSQVNDLWKAAKDRLRQLLAEPDSHGLADDPDTAQRRTAARQRQQDRLRTAAQTLPESQRQVVLMRLAGRCFREIGAVVGLSEAGAESRWRYARNNLARQGLIAA